MGDMLINYKDNKLEMIYKLKNEQELGHTFSFDKTETLLEQ